MRIEWILSSTLVLGLASCGGSSSEVPDAGASGGATHVGSGGTSGGSGGAATGGYPGAAGSGGGVVGTGGSTGGSTGGGGSLGNASVCNFASGLNVAWISFANDIPNPNTPAFQALFRNTYAAGGRIVRWWLHTNGTVTPGYDATGKAMKLPQSHIDGVKSILAAAHAAGVAVNISLWSFDMLQANAGNAHTNNQALLENDSNRQAYIDNYLTPLVTALKGTPGLYSYEIFNEPEGMIPSGWAIFRTQEKYIQMCVNWFAAAIHAADPTVLVTNGAQTFDYCSNVAGKTNYYSDTALTTVGGRPGGTLDFYEVHYYAVNGTSNSSFLNPASHWRLDKKLVMGEFYAAAVDGVAAPDLYTNLYTGGYNGGWAWQYNDGDAAIRWPTMQVPLQNVYNAHMTEVAACP